MSTAIPPNPNAIIAALLDIASAAHELIHVSRKDTLDGKPVVILDNAEDPAGLLHERLWRLDRLPQPEVDGHLTGPARARHYMQSFLEGGVTLNLSPEQAEIIRKTWDEGGVPAELEAAQIWRAPDTPLFSTRRKAALYDKLRAMHWSEDAPYCVISTKDLTLGVQTYTGDMLDEILSALPNPTGVAPEQSERRMRPRFVEPSTPGAGKEALVEATRPLFAKAMTAHKFRVEQDGTSYKGLTEHRWEGWRAAVESMGFKVSPSEALTNMLADTADEALRIINDADVLKNLHALFDDPFTEVIIDVDPENGQWQLHISPSDRRAARTYQSTSFHQVIVVAHKGEHDRRYPEPDERNETGLSPQALEAIDKGAMAQQVASVIGVTAEQYKHDMGAVPVSTVGNSDQRTMMNHLLVRVKDTLGVPTAKEIIKNVGKSAIMANIATANVEAVIEACEAELRKPRQ